MYEELCSFCKTEVEPLKVLKGLLSRKAQIEQYDTIYSNYIDNDKQGQQFTTTVIPGLAYKIKLLIFAAYYREELYKALKYDAKLQNSPQFLQFLEKQLQDERIIEDSFCEITYITTIYRILSAIYKTTYQYIQDGYVAPTFETKPYPYPKPSSSELLYWKEEELKRKREFDKQKDILRSQIQTLADVAPGFEFERVGDLVVHNRDLLELYDQYSIDRLPNYKSLTFKKKPTTDKLYFQYVLFGSASVTKFEDISDGLYIYNHIKLFSAAFLFHTKTGPHDGFYDENPPEFFKHDLNHLRSVISNFVSAKDYQECSILYNNYRSKPSSFGFRYVCMILFLAVFDGLIKHNASLEELLAEPNKHFDCEDDVFFPADNFYCMKWILDAFDIDPEVAGRVKQIMDVSKGRLKCQSSSPKIIREYAEAFTRLT